MCDYSLACVSSRDAVEGERLIVHRFPNGVKGFVSQPEVLAFTAGETGVWKKIWNWFCSRTPYAICLPAGARLIMRDVPDSLRMQLGVGCDEEVTMVQSGTPDAFRDAVRFQQGTEILIQRLPVGQVADVLSLSRNSRERKYSIESESPSLTSSTPF